MKRWSLTFATQMLFRRSGSELFDTFTNIILRRLRNTVLEDVNTQKQKCESCTSRGIGRVLYVMTIFISLWNISRDCWFRYWDDRREVSQFCECWNSEGLSDISLLSSCHITS